MAGRDWSVAGALLLHWGWGARRPGATGRQHPSGSPSPASPASWDGASAKKSNRVVYKNPGWGCLSVPARGMVCVWGGRDSRRDG